MLRWILGQYRVRKRSVYHVKLFNFYHLLILEEHHKTGLLIPISDAGVSIFEMREASDGGRFYDPLQRVYRLFTLWHLSGFFANSMESARLVVRICVLKLIGLLSLL